jgi:carbonyl reductase 1
MQHIVVTGGSSGIGLALCKRLATEKGAYVYLGSRNVTKGQDAVNSILSSNPTANGKLEMLNIDVCDDASCASAASSLKAKGVTLYALVNNAGIGLAHEGITSADIMNTNYKGPHRVTEAMVELIAPGGRIVNMSSGVASMFLKTQDAECKALYSNPNLTMEELETRVAADVAAGNLGMGDGYGLSKAALSALTIVQGNKYPNLTITSVSPGFIDTPMTAGFGARLTPEEGCVSALKCLYDEGVVSGYYYGSDGLRSPLTMTRDPGTPEYQGEDDPDATIYNK